MTTTQVVAGAVSVVCMNMFVLGSGVSVYNYGQQHITTYTCNSILALNALKKERYKI
jgi:hypothetical protein